MGLKPGKLWSDYYIDAEIFIGLLATPVISAVTTGIVFLLMHGLRMPSLTQELRVPLIIGISFGTVMHLLIWMFFNCFYNMASSSPPPLNWPTGPNINVWIIRMLFIGAMKKKSITKGVMLIGWIALLCWCISAFESPVFLVMATGIIIASMVADFIMSLKDDFSLPTAEYPLK